MLHVVERVISVLLISEEEREEEEEDEQQNFQPTAKVGAKKQKKLEEKQAKKAQREVRGPYCKLMRLCLQMYNWYVSTLFFSTLCRSTQSRVFGGLKIFCRIYWSV